MLPSAIRPPTSEEIAVFDGPPSDVAAWLKGRFHAEGSSGWVIERPNPGDLDEAFDIVMPNRHRQISRYLLVPLSGSWTVLLNDATLGTDTGMLPSLWARDGLGSAIRAVAVPQRTNSYEATILEVYDPKAADEVLRLRRAISAMNDGGRWRFDQEGEPFSFEATDLYSKKRIRERFSPDVLYQYLVALGVPALEESELGFAEAILLRRNPI